MLVRFHADPRLFKNCVFLLVFLRLCKLSKKIFLKIPEINNSNDFQDTRALLNFQPTMCLNTAIACLSRQRERHNVLTLTIGYRQVGRQNRFR